MPRVLVAWATLTLVAAPSMSAPPGAGEQAFERHVRPILVEHCQGCHGAKKQMGGLRLDTREGLAKGGDGGGVVRAGDPEGSRLIQAVRHAGELKMPPRKKLPAEAVAALEDWVKAGAAWPAERVAVEREAWRRHWAFTPVQRPSIPNARNGKQARNPIDDFVLVPLDVKGLSLSPEADRRTLIRRLTFDLVGLPPAPEETEAFLADTRPGAYERLVDRLLASPRHGERWGRYWLDVARYADTKGYVFFEEADYPWGWTYRDYVIESFNEDRPYDCFLVEQIAADQLDLGADRRPLRALGFLALGGRFMNNVQDILDDKIDVVTRGLMGLTVSCARCHDHKFDPVPTADYYSLYGVFASTHEPTVPPLYAEPPETEVYAKFTKELAKREKALADFLAEKLAAVTGQGRTRAAEYLLAAHARKGQPKADDFMLLADGNDINPTMLVRWQSYLERTAKSHHPVWGPWHAFAGGGKPTGRVNPLVAGLFACPPASIEELARRYGSLLNEIDILWKETIACRRSANRLADADAEELRQVLYGPEAPARLEPGQISSLELLPDRPAQAELQKLGKAVEQWRSTGPGAPARANVLLDLARPVEPMVFRRGSPNNPGERVPRRLPAVLGDRSPFAKGSGRLELANAIADGKNPLTARVMVNRVWMHHFGRGLVETPGDFGLRADAPSHPELLDWLADEFVRSGWSLKQLHRLIVTSSTYRQSSVDRPDCRAKDPENALLWRMNRRRLDLEALRDSLLAVSGHLDATVGGPSVKDALTPNSRRRTLYAWVDRLNVPGLFRTFDFPTPDVSSPRRDATLVPQQALFLMNGPLALHAAKGLADRSGEDVKRMYRIGLGRDPDDEEARIALAFAGADRANWARLAQALLLSNEFVFVD